MANATDTRIVQMMFDNKQFERGIKISEKSLDKFKERLNFSKYEKGFEILKNSVKKLDFSQATENLQKLTDKFTGLGTVSEHVLSQIRREIDKAAQSVSGFVKSLTFDQIGAGKTKFEELNKNVKTIMSATGRSEEEVMKVMQRLNAYTDQTSYNFTDMAANIGKFTSAGIKLEDAEKEMEGIANWAARSGAGIQEASRAMYNLSQAIGMGKLTVMDWKSIENANMATKEFKEQLIQAGLAAKTLVIDDKGNIKTAKSLGKQIEVNYKNLRSTLQKGWATNQVLEKALLGYYYEDLYYENQKVVQLTQEMLKKNEELFKDNHLDLKEWGTLVQNGIINKDVQKTILDIAAEQKNLVKETDKNGKDIYYVLDKNNKKIQVTMDNIAETLQYGWLDKNIAMRLGLIEDLGEESYKSAQKCTTLTDVFNAWKDQLSTGWMRFWQKIFGGMTESMELFSTICNKVGDSFSNFIRVLVGDGEKIEGIFGAWEILGGRDSLWSMFVGEYDGMYEGAYGFLDVLQDIGQMISHGFWSMVKLINPDLANMSDEEWFANETYRTQEFAFMLKDAIDKVKNFIQGIKDFMTEVPAGAKKSRFEQVQDVVNGVMSIAVIAYNTVRDIVGFVEILLDQNHLGPAIDSIIEVFSMLGMELSKAAGETSKGQGLGYFLQNLLGILGNKDEGLIGSINDFIGFIKELTGWLLGLNGEESATIKLWQLLADFWTKKLKKTLMYLNHVIVPVIGFFKDLLVAGKQLAASEIDFTGFVDRVKASIKKAVNSIFSFTPDFVGKIQQIFADIKEVFNSGFSRESIEKLTEHAGEIFEDLKKKIPVSVKKALRAVQNGVQTFTQKALDKIKGYFRPFVDNVKNVFESGFSGASIKQLFEYLKSVWTKIAEKIPQGIKDGFDSTIDKIKGKVRPFIDRVKAVYESGFSGESIERLKEYLKNLWSKITEKIPEGIRNSYRAAVENIKAKIMPFIERVKNVYKTGFSGESIQQLKEYLKGVWSKIAERIPEGVKTGFSNIVKRISSAVSPFVNDVKAVFEEKFSAESLENLKERLKTIWSKVTERIPQGIKEGFYAIIARIRNLFRPVIEKISSIFEKGLNGDTIDNLKESLKGFWEKIKSALTIKKKDGSEVDLTTAVSGMIGSLGFFGILKWILRFRRAAKLVGALKTGSILKIGGAIAVALGGIGAIIGNSDKFLDEGQHDLFSTIIAWIKSGTEKIATAFSDLFSGKFNIISKIKEALHLDGSNEIVAWFKEKIAAIKSKIQQLVGNEKGNAESFGKAVIDYFKAWGSRILLGILAIVGTIAIVKLVKKIVNVVNAITDGIGVIAKACKNGLKSLLGDGPEKVETFGDKMLKFAGALAILTACVLLIGNMEKGEAEKALLVVLGLAAILTAMSVLMTKVIFKNVSPEEARTMILGVIGFAAALAIMAFAVSQLAWIKSLDQVGYVITTLFGVMLMLGAFAYAIKKIDVKMEPLLGIAALCIGIAALMYVMAPIAQSEKFWEILGKSLLMLFGVLALFGVFAVALSKLMGKGLAKTELIQLAALALAIAILVYALTPLSLMSDEQTNRMMKCLGAMLMIIGVFIVIVSTTQKGLNGTALGQMAALAGAIAILALAMIPLGMMPKKMLDQAISALAKIILLVSVMVAVVGFMNKINANMKDTGMANLLAVAGAIVILVLALIPLALMPKELLDKAISAMAQVMLILVAAIVVISLMNKFGGNMKNAGVVTVLAIAGAIVVLCLLLIPLSMMPLEDLAKAVGALAVIMIMFAAVALAISKLQKTQSIAGGIAVLAAIAGVVYILGETLKGLKGLDWKVIAAFTGGLAAIIVAMGLMIGLLSLIKDPVTMFAAMGALVAGISLLLLAIAAIVPIIMNAIASGLENMMAKLAVVAGMFGNFVSNMDSISESGLESIKRKFEILYNMIVAIKDVGSYLQSVDRFATCVERLGSAMSLYNTLTQGLEDPENSVAIKFMNMILDKKDDIAGFSVGTFATGMQNLGSGLAAFTDNASGITNDEPASWKLLKRFLDNKDAIIALGSTDFGVTTKGIQGLGGALSIFAKGANEAGGIPGGVDQEKVNAALEIMNAITTGINEKGGFVIPNIPKEDEIGTFPSDLAALAMALSGFATACKDFDNSNTGNALDALGFLGQLNTNLTSDKLAVANVFTDAGVQPGVMSQFALDIRSLGAALHSFWLRTKDIGDTSNSEKSLTYFKNLSKDLDTQLIQKTKVFEGTGVDNTTLGQFALDITALGGALANFANNTHFKAGVKETFDRAIEALGGLVDLSNKMPKIGGVKQFLEGYNQSLGSLSEDLEKLGPGMADFAKAVTETFDFSDEKAVKSMHNGLTIINDLVTILSQMGRLGEAFKWGTPEDLQSYTTYYTSMIRLFMQKLAHEIPGLTSDINGVESNVDSLGTNLVTILKNFDEMLDFKGGLKNENAADIMRSLSEALLNLAEAAAKMNAADGEVSFKSVGEYIAQGVADGILSDDSDSIVCEAAREMIRRIWKAANEEADSRSPSRLFRDYVGRYLPLGVAVGITKNTGKAETAAEKMINEVIEAARETAKVKSPSRVFMELGSYLGAGLTLGIEGSNPSVVKASIAMANSSIDAMKEALGIHSPSTEAAELGGYIIDGYRQGVEKEEKNLHTMLESVGEGSLDAMQEGWQSAAKNDPLFSLKAAQFKLDTDNDETVKNGIQTYLNDLSRAGEQEVKKQALRRNYFSNFWHTLQTAFYVGLHDGRLPDKTHPNGLTMEEWDDFNNNILAPVLAGLAFGTIGTEHAVRKTVETQAQNFNIRIIRWAWGAYQDVKKGINEAIPGIIQGYGKFVGDTFGKSNETAVENIAENLVPSEQAESNAKAKIKEEAPNFFANLAKFAGSFMRNNFKGSENSDLDFWGNLVFGGLTPSAKAETDAETKIKEEAPNFMASLTQFAGDFIRNNFKGSENRDLDFWGNLIAGIIKPSSNTATNTEQTVVQTANDFFSGLAKEAIGAFSHGSVSPLGGLLIDSVIGGMNNEEQAILNTMEAIMQGTTAKAFDTVEAHSPSEIFTQLGEFMMIGLGNGIENKSGEVEAKVQRVMDHLINLTGGPFANLTALLENGIDATPTITPVLNLTGVESGIQAMNGMIGNAPFGLALNGGMLSIDPSSASLLTSSIMPKDYTAPIQGIQNEVGELRSDIQNLSESMRQMKFVFNSGQVVAAIGPEMDAYLGQQGYYAVRGEIP